MTNRITFPNSITIFRWLSVVTLVCSLLAANTLTSFGKKLQPGEQRSGTTAYQLPAQKQSYTELTNWLQRNQSMLIKRIGLLQELNAPGQEKASIRRLISDATLVSRIWAQVIQVIDSLKTSEAVKTQARRYSIEVIESSNKQINTTDRRTLIELIDRFDGSAEVAEMEKAIRQAVQNKRLSPRLGDPLILETRKYLGQQSGANQVDRFSIVRAAYGVPFKPIPVICIVILCIPIYGIFGLLHPRCRGK